MLAICVYIVHTDYRIYSNIYIYSYIYMNYNCFNYHT